jgi:hypothetical protein
MKGIYLILVMIIVALVINQLISLRTTSAEEAEEVELITEASDIANILTGSDRCLAYEEIENIHRIIDERKLRDFSSRYYDIDPDCAKNFVLAYRVEVETLPIDIPNTVRIESNKWSFGDLQFSKDKALENEITISIPVVVYYNMSVLIPGTMKITLVSGELEKLVGFIEQTCLAEADGTFDINLHYPVYLKVQDEKNYLCMKFVDEERCQRLTCEKEVEFKEIKAPGHYKIYSKTEGNVLRIMV